MNPRPRLLEALKAEEICEQLAPATRAWLTELSVLPSVDSTNSWLIQQPEPAGRVVLAEHQSQGRGRRGRSWNGLPGENIALSLAFDRTESLGRISSLSLAAGLAAVDALGELGVEGVELKWPNDLLLAGAKLGGILIELHTLMDRPVVVVGLGLNLGGAASLQKLLQRPVADLVDYQNTISRNQLAARLINSLVDFERTHRAEGFAPMREAWQGLHRYQGQLVRLTAGNQVTAGRAVGVSVDGELILEIANRRQLFAAGEVSLNEPDSPLL